MTNKQKEVLPFYEHNGWKIAWEHKVKIAGIQTTEVTIKRKVASCIMDISVRRYKDKYEFASIGPNGEFDPPRSEHGEFDHPCGQF